MRNFHPLIEYSVPRAASVFARETVDPWQGLLTSIDLLLTYPDQLNTQPPVRQMTRHPQSSCIRRDLPDSTCGFATWHHVERHMLDRATLRCGDFENDKYVLKLPSQL